MTPREHADDSQGSILNAISLEEHPFIRKALVGAVETTARLAHARDLLSPGRVPQPEDSNLVQTLRQDVFQEPRHHEFVPRHPESRPWPKLGQRVEKQMATKNRRNRRQHLPRLSNLHGGDRTGRQPLFQPIPRPWRRATAVPHRSPGYVPARPIGRRPSRYSRKQAALDHLRPRCEADECGAMNEWLAVASQAEVAHGPTGCLVSLNDMADRAPARPARR